MFPFVPGFASSLFDLLFFICTSRLFEEDAEFENLFRERKVHSAVKPAPPRYHLRSLFHFAPSRSLPKPCFQKSRGRKSLSPALSRGAGAQGAKSFLGGEVPCLPVAPVKIGEQTQMGGFSGSGLLPAAHCNKKDGFDEN